MIKKKNPNANDRVSFDADGRQKVKHSIEDRVRTYRERRTTTIVAHNKSLRTGHTHTHTYNFRKQMTYYLLAE